MAFTKFPHFPLMGLLAFCAALLVPRAAAQPGYEVPVPGAPVLPPIDYHAEASGTGGRWSIYAPTIPGWHYSLEQLAADGLSWQALPDGQFYGNGQDFKYFVTQGPPPAAPGGAPPPAGTPTWQLRFISFTLYAQKNGLSTSFRLQRAASSYPGAGLVAAWDATLTDALPAMPVGRWTYLFQGWNDPEAKIIWNTQFQVVVTEAPPAADGLEVTGEETTELTVFQKVKSQLIGAITTPYTPGPPLVAGPKQIIRLRRTAIDTNNNGIPNWWELANRLPDLTPFNAAADDPDGDGLSTLLEYQRGTLPHEPDTDGDGLSDGAETGAGSDPLHFNMPAFTLVSAWRKVELAEKIKRPLVGPITMSLVGKGSGGGTSLGALFKTYSPPPASLPSFPGNFSSAANSTWDNGSPFIPQPLEPLEGHDLSLPLNAWRIDRMHGDGGFINVTLNTSNVNLNSEDFRDISRSVTVFERAIRVKASRPMSTPWRIPYTRHASNIRARGGPWNGPVELSGTFTFLAGQSYSDTVSLSLSLGRMGGSINPEKPGHTRRSPAYLWDDPTNTTEVRSVEWLTIGQFSASSTSFAYDNDQDGVSNELELKMGTDPNQRNSDGSGYADGDQLNKGVLPPPDGLVMSTRRCEYEFSPDDSICPGHPANRLAVETDIPVVNYLNDPNGARLNLDTSLQNALSNHGPFPPDAPTGPPMPLLDATGSAASTRPISEMKYTESSTKATAAGTQRRLWSYTAEPPPANFSRTYLKIKTEQRDAAAATTTTTEVIKFEFTPAAKTSTNYIDLPAKRTATNGQSANEQTTKVTEDLLPVEVAPDVLAVNSDFDEGRVNGISGYAIPDCDDPGRFLGPERAHLEGRWAMGTKVTEDMHQGWFGVKPSQLGADFWNGSTVMIKKIDKTDPDTNKPESGEVRFYATDGVGNASGYQCIEPYDLTTHAVVNLVGGGIYGAPSRSVYGMNTDISSSAKFWIEGVKPGKITLEWRYVKGSTDVKHEQTFIVATHQTKTKWIDEIRYQILLQSQGQKDLKQFIPVEGYLPKGDGAFGSSSFIYNHPRVAAIYDWYGQLYQQYPEKLDWMGAASQVGGAVYGGLCGMYSPSNITSGFQATVGPQLMGGAILILRDIGWQHRAWIASGLPALKWVEVNDPASVNGIAGQRALEMDVWEDFDKAIKDNNWANIKQASKDLVRREQAEVIVPMWIAIRDINGRGTTSGFLVAAGSIPDFYPKNPADPQGYNFQQVVPNGNIEQYPDRDRFSFGWDGLRPGQPSVAPAIASKGVFPVWWGEQASSYGTYYDAARRLQLVRFSLLDRAVAFARPGDIIYGR